MQSTDADLAAQARRTADAFRVCYGGDPSFAACAPGRVNLIGEHTDYNDGFVLPMAIERQTLIVAAPRADTLIRLRSTALDGEAALDLRQGVGKGQPKWSNYLRGVIARWLEGNELPAGFDALLDSTVPGGGGLSSSASIEVAMATLLEALTATQLPEKQKALMAQWAEHHYAGMPCGIMDQFASTLGHAGQALLIDCRSQQVTHVPVPDDLAIVIANSNKKHELTGGEYAERRAQCGAAARILGVKALRDATLEMLEEAKGQLADAEYHRARHIITENDRVLVAVDALRKGDWPTVGRAMIDSHLSMRDDFEISTPELDALVDAAAAIGPDGGVIGARMTGGGFGGCTVTLTAVDAAERVADQLALSYKDQTGIDATIFTTRPAEGARILDLGELLG